MEDRTQLGSIQTSVEQGIAKITFSHPAHNSLPGKLLAELTDAINKAGQNNLVQVIILQSGGERTFCAGASFDELMSIENLEQGERFFMGFANVINAIRQCPKFVIGRVQGKAIGGGVGLAAATDFCFATKFSAIKLSELAIGIGPFVVGPAVARKVGQSAFQQLAIDATSLQTAQWAQEKGLFNEVFDDANAMDEAIVVLTKKLAASSPDAMRHLKITTWQGTEHWNELLHERAKISGELILSSFAKNAIAAFKKK